MEKFFRDKDILVTGGCGSVGSEIIRQLLKYDVKRVRSFDNRESGQFHLQQGLPDSRLRVLIGDVRDTERLKRAMKGVDIVFHAAALKHVPLCEYNPFEAVATNVGGTQNVINAVREEGVERMISISTDKAANPVNTMGATKLLSEKLIMNASLGEVSTFFSCVRFGNVLYSEGSVIPVFIDQIKKGGPVTITSEDMIRFFMNMPEAAGLVLRSAQRMKGREIFILKMKSLRISDLAGVLIEELAPLCRRKPEDIKVKTVGKRPGEKILECLMTEDEAGAAEDLGDMFVIRPGIVTPHYSSPERAPHSADYEGKQANLLSKDEIRKLLRDSGLLSKAFPQASL